MSTSSTVSAAIGFSDLATFGELEAMLYGGPYAITQFVKSIQKSNWFALVTQSLRINPSSPDFGATKVTVALTRQADYILGAWFRCQIPVVVLTPATGQTLRADAGLRWTKFLMHNIFDVVSLQFNEMSMIEYDSHYLDFMFQFRTPGGKRIGYRNMVGDIAELVDPTGTGNGIGVNVPLGSGGFYNVPFCFSFFEDTGLAIPVAALPFNQVIIQFDLRNWIHLVVVYPGTGTDTPATTSHVKLYSPNGSTEPPSIGSPEAYAHYALVHRSERVKMGATPRDYLIIQQQSGQKLQDKAGSNLFTQELLFGNSIITIFFAFANTSIGGRPSAGYEWSNYTTEFGYKGASPIAQFNLRYDNNLRWSMGIDYYSLIVPFYFCEHAIPEETGYGMITYSTRPFSTDPFGSTNFTKLANVTAEIVLSNAATNAKNTTAPVSVNGTTPIQWPSYTSSGLMEAFPQTYSGIFISRAWQVVRSANGSMGYPAL